MISQIKEEADASAAKILEEAQTEAEEIRKKGEDECARIRERAEVQNEAAKADILSKSRSSAQMERRRYLLLAKQEMIDEVINEAHASLLALDTPAYFDALVRLVEKHAQAQCGEIRFNQKDLCRIPADFMRRASEAAKKNGGDLILSDEPCEIDGGFLLVYGDIEENCSFDALFLADREVLQDKLHTFLFA